MLFTKFFITVEVVDGSCCCDYSSHVEINKIQKHDREREREIDEKIRVRVLGCSVEQESH